MNYIRMNSLQMPGSSQDMYFSWIFLSNSWGYLVKLCYSIPPFKSLGIVMFSKRSHQSCIYLIKNTVKTDICEILLQFKITVFCCKIYLKCNLFLWCAAEFSASLLQSSVSHDPSEIILICWFAAQETFLIIIINVKKYRCIFQDSLMNRKFKRTAFI